MGLQWRRLGRASVNLYDYGELIEAGEARDSEEGLRLFHVAATRARERLILSGVVKPEPPKEMKPGTAVIERLVEALGVSRPSKEPGEAEATRRPQRTDGPPDPRRRIDRRRALDHRGSGAAGRAACRGWTRPSLPSEIAVHLNEPSPERAAELRDLHLDAAADRPLGSGTPPLVERKPPIVPSRPLSYTAISRLRGMRLSVLHGAGARDCRLPPSRPPVIPPPICN